MLLPLLALLGFGGGAFLLSRNSSAAPAPDSNHGVMTPERDTIFQTAMSSVTDPKNLQDLAATFTSEGLPAQAASLTAKANSIIASQNSGAPIDLSGHAPVITPANPINLGNPAPVINHDAAVAAAAQATAVANGFSATANPAATAVLNQAVADVSPVPAALPILRIQQIFNQFPQPNIAKLTEDGLPGASTDKAINTFQANNGIDEAPISKSPLGHIASVGPMTANAIFALTQSVPTAFELPDGSVSMDGSENLDDEFLS